MFSIHYVIRAFMLFSCSIILNNYNSYHLLSTSYLPSTPRDFISPSCQPRKHVHTLKTRKWGSGRLNTWQKSGALLAINIRSKEVFNSQWLNTKKPLRAEVICYLLFTSKGAYKELCSIPLLRIQADWGFTIILLQHLGQVAFFSTMEDEQGPGESVLKWSTSLPLTVHGQN